MKNDDGFTLAETLISIFIVCLLTLAGTFLFTTVIKNTDRFYENSSKSMTLIKTDFFLRKEIEKTVIPYYENGENLAYIKASEIMLQIINGVELRSCEILHSKNGKVRGLCVIWELDKGKEYKTVALFTSIPVSEK
jgi:prepilin-type N-terminal cleavage/methylation domain-containing protein